MKKYLTSSERRRMYFKLEKNNPELLRRYSGARGKYKVKDDNND